jgi:hypothetical protein
MSAWFVAKGFEFFSGTRLFANATVLGVQLTIKMESNGGNIFLVRDQLKMISGTGTWLELNVKQPMQNVSVPSATSQEVIFPDVADFR